MRTVLVAAALMMTANGAMAATQFDLNCTGSKTVQPGSGAPIESSWDRHLRVDLQVGEYCDGDCSHLQLMVTAKPNIIVFEAQEDQVSKDFTAVSRETGEFFSSHLSKLSLDSWTIKGMCDPAPFSGIPILTH